MTLARTHPATHVEPVMGTVVSLAVAGAAPPPEAVEDVFRWLHEVDATFSPYRPDSAVRRLDRGELRLADAGADLRWVVEQCAVLRAETGGYFHASASGRFDPSALVKGWAVQRAADRLCLAGIADFCLTAGGDVATRGAPEAGGSWRVGIQHPCDRNALAAVVEARDGLAVATSGTCERGEHIVVPGTGRPPRGVLSVTVVGPDLGRADAYATAAFAMGAGGPAWTLGLRGYEAMTILADATVLSTPGFPVLAR
jgi:FAD:protein FMN transferase